MGGKFLSFTALCGSLALSFLTAPVASADPLPAGDSKKPVRVGVCSVLSGELGVLGKNIVLTTETYLKHYARHPIQLIAEDGKLGSADGLRAYQKLFNVDQVDMAINGCSTNGLAAAQSLINSTRTPTISVVTGGKAADDAGPYVFRIGNSDTLNGKMEAELFIERGLKNVAILIEETEYTNDLRIGFVPRFTKLGGNLVFNEGFPPGTTDFRTLVSRIKRSNPSALFVPTQTGTALALFLKQWRDLSGPNIPVHTSFVAAPNPDAWEIAGPLLVGVEYMDPAFDDQNAEWKKFVELYRKDHGVDPAIPFHSAGVIDSLNHLQAYLDEAGTFDRDGFGPYLLKNVQNYKGIMGTYSFDSEGNANTGFTSRIIEKK